MFNPAKKVESFDIALQSSIYFFVIGNWS